MSADDAKRGFLERKGLTAAEIAEAFARVPSLPTSPPPAAPAPYSAGEPLLDQKPTAGPVISAPASGIHNGWPIIAVTFASILTGTATAVYPDSMSSCTAHDAHTCRIPSPFVRTQALRCTFPVCCCCAVQLCSADCPQSHNMLSPSRRGTGNQQRRHGSIAARS